MEKLFSLFITFTVPKLFEVFPKEIDTPITDVFFIIVLIFIFGSNIKASIKASTKENLMKFELKHIEAIRRSEWEIDVLQFEEEELKRHLLINCINEDLNSIKCVLLMIDEKKLRELRRKVDNMEIVDNILINKYLMICSNRRKEIVGKKFNQFGLELITEDNLVKDSEGQ